MEKHIFDRYVSIQTELQQKQDEFKKSNESLTQEIVTLEQELSNRRKAFDESINDLVKEKDSFKKDFIHSGKGILNNISKLIESKYGWYYPREAVLGFGIIREIAADEDVFDLDKSDFDITRCKLDHIKEITDTHVKFYAEEISSDGWLSGYISIPIEYFITKCLNDETYIKSIYDQIDSKIAERKNAEKANEIAELEAKLAKLKGEQ